MKRVTLFLVSLILVISFAAPSGAVFAAETPAVVSPEEMTTTESVASIESEELVEQPQLPVASEALGPITPSTEQNSVTPGTAVVIAQIQVGAPSPSNASDEYVSIYNNGDDTVDVTGWCLRNKQAGGTKKFACLNEPDVDYYLEPGAFIGFSSVVPRMGQHALLVSFLPGSNHIIASNDSITLVDAADKVVDTVAWNEQKKDHYAIERLWQSDAPGRPSPTWEWLASLPTYGFIEQLVECADGTVVRDMSHCPPPQVEVCSNLPDVRLDVLPPGFEVQENGECRLVGPSLQITELMPNPLEGSKGDEFIELYNPGDEAVDLAWWELMVGKKSFAFPAGASIPAKSYYVVTDKDVKFTLPNETGIVQLYSREGSFEFIVPAWSKAKNGQAWALIEDEWRFSSIATPGEANKLPPEMTPGFVAGMGSGLADCGEGRERNPATGRCRNIPTEAVLSPCKEGQYRSEETNRCRSIATAAASELKPCADGQFRNPETNRCKKIASSEDVAMADCGEGRERNPVTNRCRNIKQTAPPAADFAVEPVRDSASVFVGWWVLGGVSLVAVGYAGWEWREEIGRLIARIFRPGKSAK